MYKILTQNGILTTTSEAIAKTIAINAARSGETAVLATTSCEYLVLCEGRGSVIAYSVTDMWNKGNDSLISAYRECCFAAHAAEERKAREAACKSAAASTSKANSSKGNLGSDLLSGIFEQFFGDFTPSKKKK